MRPSRGLPTERIRLPPHSNFIPLFSFNLPFFYPLKNFSFFYIIPYVLVIHLKNISLTHNNSIFFSFSRKTRVKCKCIRFLSSFFLDSPGDVEGAPTRRRLNSIQSNHGDDNNTAGEEHHKNASNQNMN